MVPGIATEHYLPRIVDTLIADALARSGAGALHPHGFGYAAISTPTLGCRPNRLAGHASDVFARIG